MRKDRLYFFTFLSISLIFVLIATIAKQYFIRESTIQLLETQLESSKREVRQIAIMASGELDNSIDKNNVIENIQKGLEKTNFETSFVSVFDWSGVQICHPDITLVGQQMTSNQTFVSSIEGEISSEDLYNLLIIKGDNNEIEDIEKGKISSEIIYLYPIANSDLIVGAHANFSKIESQITNLRNRFYIILIIMGFVIISSSVITVRILGSFYEKKLEKENKDLEGELINLAKLNSALGDYKQKVVEESSDLKTEKQESATEQEIVAKDNTRVNEENSVTEKKRILTYLRDELLAVPTDQIAYIYTENTITYVVDIHGKRSTTNTSLDELYNGLNASYFYRANRQFIIAISAIDKIIRYGNNQLKLLVAPKSEIDIIIGKNKAAEFKQWLNL